MDLLHQMADDEAASVNAGINHVDDDDDGVPLPKLPPSALNANQAGQTATADDTADDDGKKKAGKASAKKSKGGREDASQTIQRNRAFWQILSYADRRSCSRTDRGKSFAAEKEAKAAKKQEEKAKKEEEKNSPTTKTKSKRRGKRGCQEGKSRKQQHRKRKEKQAEKEKKAAAKQAKLEAEGAKSAFRLRRWQLALCLVPRWAALLS